MVGGLVEVLFGGGANYVPVWKIAIRPTWTAFEGSVLVSRCLDAPVVARDRDEFPIPVSSVLVPQSVTQRDDCVTRRGPRDGI